MCISKNLKDDPTIPKKLCNLEVCVSCSQARRLISCLSEDKIKKIIEKAEKEKKEKGKI